MSIRLRRYGDNAGAILVTGLFLFGAIASIVSLIVFIFTHWWAFIIGGMSGAFFLAVLGDSEAIGSRPVSINTPTNSDMIQGRYL